MLEIAAKVKKESKGHKKRVKDLRTSTKTSALDKQYEVALRALGDEALRLATGIQTYINQNSADSSDLEQIHAEGTGHRAIMAVNTVLHGRWPFWKGKIKKWTKDRHDMDNLSFMDPAMQIGLDYIGSLAKGYKGPPKQGVRFMPEKFDVDASLVAPPLAAYALVVGNAIVDRGRIWSKHAGPALFNGLLEPMEKDMQQHLEAAGLIEMGMDKNEPFEVVIEAEGIEKLPNAPQKALASKALSEKDLRIRNKLHALRKINRKRFRRIGKKLVRKGFTTTDDMHELLTAHDDENQIYAFTDSQLDQIEKLIDETR